MRKEHPIPNPDREKRGKRSEEQTIVPAETAPPWAAAMQQTIMEHVSLQVQGLKAEVDETKALALEAQEQARVLQKEIQELRESRSVSPATMRSLRSLETEFMVNYFSWTMFFHFVQWQWYSELVHEIPVILVVLSSKMDGI